MNHQAHILQRLPRAIGVAHPVHGDRRHDRGGIVSASPSRTCYFGNAHFGDTTTPQGSRPTGIDFTTSDPATSITEMSLESPLVVSRYFWSGVKAICHTRCPTNRYLRTS